VVTDGGDHPIKARLERGGAMTSAPGTSAFHAFGTGGLGVGDWASVSWHAWRDARTGVLDHPLLDQEKRLVTPFILRTEARGQAAATALEPGRGVKHTAVFTRLFESAETVVHQVDGAGQPTSSGAASHRFAISLNAWQAAMAADCLRVRRLVDGINVAILSYWDILVYYDYRVQRKRRRQRATRVQAVPHEMAYDVRWDSADGLLRRGFASADDQTASDAVRVISRAAEIVGRPFAAGAVGGGRGDR